MAYRNKNVRSLQDHWNSVHVTVIFSSLIYATVIFFIFLFFSGPTPAMPFERKVLMYVGIYFAFFMLAELMNYLFFYLPNYFFYKRMLKDGREIEIKNMIDEYGLEKLIGKDWFIYKERTGLKSHKDIQPENEVGEE